MLAKCFATAQIGLDRKLVQVECDITNSLPGVVIVGLGDRALSEAKERVRAAIKNSQLNVPPKRIILNLAPANLPKDGTGYDVSMAVAILKATQQLDCSLDKRLFYGELSLNGSLRPLRGTLSAARLTLDSGLSELFIAEENVAEASLIKGIKIFPVRTLKQLYRHLAGEELISAYQNATMPISQPNYATDFEDIYGQEQAKRAMEIAAAGRHNILLYGPPGSGKSMLAKAAPSILPQPSLKEIIEMTEIHSLIGLNPDGVITNRPFRAPHHTASDMAMIGGGRQLRPGEISLSHRGVLFLDELPEFGRSVLEVLRQPMEEGRVCIARAGRSVDYPAKFMLIAAHNPCPCGFAGDSSRNCQCSAAAISAYSRKLSGPLLDRIDLYINMKRLSSEDLHNRSGESSLQVRLRVNQAVATQHERFRDDTTSNGDMTNQMVNSFCALDEDAISLVRSAVSSLSLSARGYLRMLKVARTIADLGRSKLIARDHISEALHYRSQVT